MPEMMISPDIRRRAAWLTGLVLLGAGAVLPAQQQIVPNAVQLESEVEEIPRYAVELIVFEYVGAAANTTEIFEPEVAVEVLSDEDFFGGIPPRTSASAETRVYSDRPLPPAEDLPISIDVPAAEDAGDAEGQPFVPLPGETLEEIPTYERAGFERLDPADYQLNGAWQRLLALDAYRPIMHTAWLQPTLEKDQTEPLKLRRIGDPPLRLDGHITLYLSRFLHLVVDLSLEHRSPTPSRSADRSRYYGDSRSQPISAFGPAFGQSSIVYRINEDRILRNNEVRYYDHPKFGVIARVTRIEEETPEDLDTTGDLLPGNPVQ